MTKMNKQLFLGLLASTLLVGCSNDDNGIVESEDNDNETNLGTTLTAHMGADHSYQVYIDLSEGEMTSVAVNTWELAFENTGNAIRTNNAKKVAAVSPNEMDFDAIVSDEGLVYTYDSEDGNLATTALADWEIDKPYIIDLGIDENGNVLGKKKFVVTATGTSSISIKYAELDGTDEISQEIDLGEGNFTYFSLMADEVVTVEPDNWDFVLTASTVRTGAPCRALGEDAIPGINCDVYRQAASSLTNIYEGVEVAMDDPFSQMEQNDDPDSERNNQGIEGSNYDTLGIDNFEALERSTSGDAIGRSWLQILAPHSSGIYKVYDFITYLVKDGDGNYFKVRFLAYRGGENAENGNPTFEYQLLSE